MSKSWSLKMAVLIMLAVVAVAVFLLATGRG